MIRSIIRFIALAAIMAPACAQAAENQPQMHDSGTYSLSTKMAVIGAVATATFVAGYALWKYFSKPTNAQEAPKQAPVAPIEKTGPKTSTPTQAEAKAKLETQKKQAKKLADDVVAKKNKQ